MNYSRTKSSRRQSRRASSGEFSNSARAKYYVFLSFVILVVLTGGASRPDVVSLLLLRPAAIIYLGLGCLMITRQELATICAPLILLGSLAALMVLQLIPLPPSIWAALPQREIVYAIAQDLNMQNQWRPLSLAPSRTLNSFMSLSVPAAAMILFAQLGAKEKLKVPRIFIVAGIISMVAGLLQVAGPPDGLFYTYNLTNSGQMVGAFANRNHHAIFLACLIPVIAGLRLDSIDRNATRKSRDFLASNALMAGGLIFLLLYILAIGSRAGALFAIAGIIVSLAMWISHSRQIMPLVSQIQQNEKFSGPNIFKNRRVWLIAIVAMVTAGVLGLAIYLGRGLAFDRFLMLDEADDLRRKILPVLFEMLKLHAYFGTGFGSFESVYKIWEPDQLLTTTYVNQAHNDVMQFWIEGGLPAAAIMSVFLLLLARQVFSLMRRGQNGGKYNFIMLAALVGMAIMLFSSGVEYALRTPIMMTYFSLSTCLFFWLSNQSLNRDTTNNNLDEIRGFT